MKQKSRVSLGVRAQILARERAPFVLLLLVMATAAVSCSRHSEVDPAKVRSRVQHFVRESLERQGGKAAILRLTSYRAEGIIILIPDRKVVHLSRWVDGSGRMRIELREKDKGEVHIVSETGAWSGPDDRSLVFSEAPLLDVLALFAARRDFPLPYTDRDSLELRQPDKKKRTVLRTRTATGILIDYHLDKKSRLAAMSIRAEEEPDLVYHVELGSYRKIRGARFPFRESIMKDDERLAEVRFREVQPSPDLPPSLFVPRVTGGPTSAADSTASENPEPDQ